MSKIVTNGNPAALVSGAIIQELDAQRNVVFQWRSWDHYPFTSQWVNSTAAVISEFHVNCVFEDTDGNLIISTPKWVKKISRQTGKIMWHLGGTENQFTFVGVSPQEGTNDFAGHGINRLPNGDVLIYNNGIARHIASMNTCWMKRTRSQPISGPTRPTRPFRGHPKATPSAWPMEIPSSVGVALFGSAPACTEVSGTNVVFQMGFTNSAVTSYRAFRSPFPSASQANSSSVIELATGNSYSFDTTGVSIDVLSGGGGYNRVTVTNEPYAPVYPLFQGKAPRVLPVRVNLSEIGIDSMNVNVNFDAASLGVAGSSEYHRVLSLHHRTGRLRGASHEL